MIANARMYSVAPQAAGLWRKLLAEVIERSGLSISLLEHTDPKPIDDLWARSDMAAVFMCGLPFSRSQPQPELIAAPVPAPEDFRGRPEYWSEMVVRKDSAFETLEDTFGRRLALTVPGSQSGYVAALTLLQARAGAASCDPQQPLYSEVIAPQITPLGALAAVAEDRAEVAPIDSYAFALLQKYRRDLTTRVRTVARTPRTPIPPIVAARSDLQALRAAFLEAHEIASIAPVMAELLLERFVLPDVHAYDALRLNHASTGEYWSTHRLAAKVHAGFSG